MEYSIISIQNEDPLHCIQMEGPLTRNGACSPLSCTCVHSHVWLFATPETVARQAPLSMGFSRQEYWSGLPFTSPGDLSNPGIEPASLVSPALAGRFFTSWATKGSLFSLIRQCLLLGETSLLVTSIHWFYFFYVWYMILLLLRVVLTTKTYFKLSVKFSHSVVSDSLQPQRL